MVPPKGSCKHQLLTCVCVTAHQWTKVSSLIPSCHVIYVIQSDDGSTQYKVLANFYQFTTTWAERTATWTNRVVTTAVFSVIADCGAPTTFKEGFSISFDDFSLKPI